jgi:exonuclease VII small subunit
MACEEPDRLAESNRKVREALRACEQQLERAREMLRKSRKDNDEQFTDYRPQ